MNNLAMKLLFGQDMRGDKGVFARGANVYNGLSMNPNPMGVNQASAAAKLLELRSKMYGKGPL